MSLPTPTPDTTAIVTGASSGIGTEIARELARRGHGLTLVARRTDLLEEVAAELRAAHGTRVEVVTADVSAPEGRTGILTALADLDLVPDVLVNNAGFSTMGPVSASDPDREMSMVRTNVEAVSHLCSLVVPGMVERGRGAVLNVASTAAFNPLPGQAGYAASKAFVLSYTEALAAELAGTGVTATALCPGPVRTGFAEAAGLGDDAAESSLPSFMWVPAVDVATAGVEALAAGRPVVLPGAASRATASISRFLPNRLLLPVLRSQHPALRR